MYHVLCSCLLNKLWRCQWLSFIISDFKQIEVHVQGKTSLSLLKERKYFIGQRNVSCSSKRETILPCNYVGSLPPYNSCRKVGFSLMPFCICCKPKARHQHCIIKNCGISQKSYCHCNNQHTCISHVLLILCSPNPLEILLTKISVIFWRLKRVYAVNAFQINKML